jgi:hypothetical protein
VLGPATRWVQESTSLQKSSLVSNQLLKVKNPPIPEFCNCVLPTPHLLTPGFWLLAPGSYY